MSKTIEKTAIQKEMQAAEKWMTIYATSAANKKELQDKIKNEIEAYNKNMKEAEDELLKIGERNRDVFDEDGNLVFEKGYLHIANNTVVLTGKKFDPTTFREVHPDMIDIKLKVAPIKKAFLDKLLRRDMKKLGIDLSTEEEMQVLVKD